MYYLTVIVDDFRASHKNECTTTKGPFMSHFRLSISKLVKLQRVDLLHLFNLRLDNKIPYIMLVDVAFFLSKNKLSHLVRAWCQQDLF